LQDHIERNVCGLRVRIDRLLCVGFGDCIEIGPEAFEFDDDGIVRFKPDADSVKREKLILACRECPVDALTVWDENDVQIVP
jgi:ferredoxin